MSKEKQILKEVKELFDKARKNPSMAKRYVLRAKKTAAHVNMKLPKELKRLYCHKCYSLFTSKNSIVRIKNGFKVVKCLECKNLNRIKLG